MGTADIQGRLWGSRPRDWADLAEPQTAPLWEAMLDAAQVGPGTHLLDVGCGAGGLAVRASGRGARLTGIDASEALVAIARERVPDARLHLGDAEELPFPDSSFDAVTSANVVQFVGDREKAVRETLRVVMPGGKVVFGLWCEPERNQISPVMGAVFSLMPQEPPAAGPPDLRRRENFLALLTEAGSRILDEQEVVCDFVFEDGESLCRGLASAGIMAGVVSTVGQEAFDRAVLEAAAPFRTGQGYRMENVFRLVTCGHG